ncbi:hypothetical protein LCGC14_0282500 [marine sediment metagenome]|uniref:Uncharacterized protein n=1 Tax=marine sediment metagenome TaxID=412755 RepID=A0A0F9WGQ3_9ZZZZ
MTTTCEAVTGIELLPQGYSSVKHVLELAFYGVTA